MKPIKQIGLVCYGNIARSQVLGVYVKNHPSEMGGMISSASHSVVFDARNSTNDGWFSSTTHSTNHRLVEFRCLKKFLRAKGLNVKV